MLDKSVACRIVKKDVYMRLMMMFIRGTLGKINFCVEDCSGPLVTSGH